MPALATIAGMGPMGHHSGIALLVRVVAVLAASSSLAGVFGIAVYVYWLHVVVPAPAGARSQRQVTQDSRGFATQTA